MPPSHRSLIARITYALAAIGAGAAVAAAFIQDAIGIKELSTAVLALLGTFLGATFAFRLNQDKEERKLQAARKEALNRALFVLARQANAVDQLKRDYDQFGQVIPRAFNLPALKPPSYSDLIHNFVDLEFLLESGEADILLRLTVEQERFHQVIESVRTRNEFYVNEFQPKLAEVGLNGRITSAEEAKALLGERIFGGVINGTNIAYEHISATVQSIPEMQQQLLALAKRNYPKQKFITYERRAA
ncbi:MAG: hypothetical protein KBC73_07630 [Burkholderiaceae bacterium]|nr:hypothetical protein [Burkholderiaceae bacterium]